MDTHLAFYRRASRRLAGGLTVLVLAALVGCGGSKSGRAPGSAPGPTPAADPYEPDPAKHVIPASPATGRLEGKPFTPDRAEIEGDWLKLRSGKDFFPDLEVSIPLGNEVKLAEGLKLVIKPTQKLTGRQPLYFSTRSGQDVPDAYLVNEGYSLTLELGKADKGNIPGKIYLCLPDEQRSYLAGTFVARRRRPISEPPGEGDVPFIRGSVSPPAKKDQRVRVGYVGRTADGQVIFEGTGTTAPPDGDGGGTRSVGPALRTAGVYLEKFTPHFDFTNLPPGRYLVFAVYKPGAAAWTWVGVAAGGRVTVDLTLDEAKLGTVAVKVPAGAGVARLVPTDLGTPPPDERFLDQLTFSIGLEAEDGTATARVPAGKYQVRTENLRADVEVTAGKTATVELKPAKN